jgi:glyoxylate/hydroxypyruvate/2-ketogluconate reductase
MSDAKVVVIGEQAAGTDKWVESAPKGFRVVSLPPTATMEDMIRAVRDADFLVLRHGDIDYTEEFFRACKKAKLIQLPGAGFDWLPLPLLQELGIPVANVGGVNAIAVAEHAVTLMLMVLRRIVPSMTALRQGKWRKDFDDDQYAELYQKTVGIVGLGNIGRWSGRIVSGFGAQVIFYDPIRMRLSLKALVPARQVGLEELMSIADVVSVHTPLSKETRGLIGRKELALMKPSAIIVNTSRGPLIDEAALIDVLRQKRIAGAGLDVFEKEPMDLTNPLLQMEHVVCTPHIGGAAVENSPRRRNQAWENFEDVLNGLQPVSLVSPGK